MKRDVRNLYASQFGTVPLDIATEVDESSFLGWLKKNREDKQQFKLDKIKAKGEARAAVAEKGGGAAGLGKLIGGWSEKAASLLGGAAGLGGAAADPGATAPDAAAPAPDNSKKIIIIGIIVVVVIAGIVIAVKRRKKKA